MNSTGVGVAPMNATSAPLSHESGLTFTEHPTTVEETIGNNTLEDILTEMPADDFDIDVFIAEFEEENGNIIQSIPQPPMSTQFIALTPSVMKTISNKLTQTSKARHDSKQWTELETECLIHGVTLFGRQKYKWKCIKNHFKVELQSRSNVDLKDRWRNLLGRKQRRKKTLRKSPYHK